MEEESTTMSVGDEGRSHIFCNNCRKYGHVFNKCKMPVISYGVILFRKRPRGLEYLMICRRNTLGYIDFLRGKYVPTHKYYIMNMLKQMTREEIQSLETGTFDELWEQLWSNISEPEKTPPPPPPPSPSALQCYNNQYRVEEYSSRVKFNMLVQGLYSTTNMHSEFFSLKTMLDEIKQVPEYQWEEPEWGFPKGRRHYQESEYHCALREFSEETGIPTHSTVSVKNLLPVEEMFMGSNYKAYKHKYFIMYLNESSQGVEPTDAYCSEVSQRSWKTMDECLESIRSYNVEKRLLIQKVDRALHKYLPCRYINV